MVQYAIANWTNASLEIFLAEIPDKSVSAGAGSYRGCNVDLMRQLDDLHVGHPFIGARQLLRQLRWLGC